MTLKDLEKLKQELKTVPGKDAEELKRIAAARQQGEKLKAALKTAEADLKGTPE